MNRAFISLYSLIVASVLLLGWGLNSFWEHLNPDPSPSREVRSLIQLTSAELNDNPGRQTVIAAALQAQGVTLELLGLDDLARSAALQQLHAGEIVRTLDRDSVSYYKLLPKGQILVMHFPRDSNQDNGLYQFLLVVFYSGVALAIYFWVWPLSRDTQKLERQIRQLGQNDLPEPLQIGNRSPLYPLALAFNQMARRLRDLLASHREMTNAVSHELRTPLARTKFALAMLDSSSQGPAVEKSLASINQDVQEMESLISALLAYAGFESQTQVLDIRPGHMTDLVLAVRARLLQELDTGLAINLHHSQPAELYSCEWKLMERVLHNLLRNACRYARQQINIELYQTPVEYCLAIEDDGPGIAASERERVFDSFVRLHREDVPRDAEAGGFGLGLAIVKRVLAWHGGEVRAVEPVSLGGARIELRWPKAESGSPS